MKMLLSDKAMENKPEMIAAAMEQWYLQYLNPLRLLIMKMIQHDEEPESYNSQSMICWDWDVIRTFINFDLPNESYAGALKGAIKILNEEKILMMDGTRDEMARYLAQKANALKRRLRDSKNYVNKENEGEGNNDSITKYINILEDDYASIRRLKDFLDKHVEYMDQFNNAFAKLPKHKLEKEAEYKACHCIVSAERGGRFRNRADSENIARLIKAKKEGLKIKMVTKTALILNNFSDYSLDPISYLVVQTIRSKYTSKELRRVFLNRCLKRLTDLINECYIAKEAINATQRHLNKHSLTKLLTALNYYRNDMDLSALMEPLSRAYLIASSRETRHGGDEKRLKDYPNSSMRKIESLVTRILENALCKRTGEEQLDVIGYIWYKGAEKKDYEKWVLQDDLKKNTIISMEIVPGEYSICWDVDITLNNLLEITESIINKKWVPKSDCIIVEVLFNTMVIDGIEVEKTGKKWCLPSEKQFAGNDDIMRARILTDYGTIYYEQGAIDLSRSPKIAVVSNDSGYRWFSCLYQETSDVYIPPLSLKKTLISKWGHNAKTTQFAKNITSNIKRE